MTLHAGLRIALQTDPETTATATAVASETAAEYLTNHFVAIFGSFLIGFALGFGVAVYVRSRTTADVQRAIALIITFVWFTSVVAAIVVPGYSTSLGIHAAMGAVTGYLFSGGEGIKGAIDSLKGKDDRPRERPPERRAPPRQPSPPPTADRYHHPPPTRLPPEYDREDAPEYDREYDREYPPEESRATENGWVFGSSNTPRRPFPGERGEDTRSNE